MLYAMVKEIPVLPVEQAGLAKSLMLLHVDTVDLDFIMSNRKRSVSESLSGRLSGLHFRLIPERIIQVSILHN